ncbi:unnamed protein product [Caenorhabditis auriculariae]|uniref:Protein kinase domain-containing protein n=1 Tax=Caenorhabditis auriculariae TaxID=2777116 RepID=A0A8S1HF21_9PELO|nr:unnamed protein product [Caenorhabditis auriculariae]
MFQDWCGLQAARDGRHTGNVARKVGGAMFQRWLKKERAQKIVASSSPLLMPMTSSSLAVKHFLEIPLRKLDASSGESGSEKVSPILHRRKIPIPLMDSFKSNESMYSEIEALTVMEKQPVFFPTKLNGRRRCEAMDKYERLAKIGEGSYGVVYKVPDELTRKITYQLLEALRFCHNHKCIHRDVKPENIFLTRSDQVKLGDFGFARIINTTEMYTDYVATRWYRSPELLVGDVQYGPPVDIWAVGCVYAELMTGEALWPGRSDIDQLYLIRKTLGDFLPRHLSIFPCQPIFFFGLSIPEPEQMEPLPQKLPNSSSSQLDFLCKCFEMSPDRRWSCSELQQHPIFQNWTLRLRADESVITYTGSKKSPNYLPLLTNNNVNISNNNTNNNVVVKQFSIPPVTSNGNPPRNTYLPTI